MWIADRSMRRIVPFVWLLAAVCFVTTARAQTVAVDRAAIRGVVTDTDGRPLSAVVIDLPGVGVHALTSDRGVYALSGLPAGVHVLRFERIGYAPATREVTAKAGSEIRLDVVLSARAIQLQELVVTGVPGVRDPLSVAASVDVVDGDALRGSRGASLGETLAGTVPGIATIGTGSQAGIPVLRGLSGTRVRVLQNGVGQEFYQYGVRHHPPTSLAEAERVEVVRGASSILYGSDALGGAVNVLTRRLPSAPEGRPHLGGELQTHLFSNNREAATLVDVHAAAGRVGARVGFESRHGGNVTTPDVPDFFETTAAGNARTGVFGDPKYTGELPHTGFRQRSGYGQLGVQGGFGEVEAFFTHWDDDNDYLLPSGGPSGSPDNPPVGVGLHLAQTNVTLKGSFARSRVVLRPTLAYQRAVRQALPAGQLIGTGGAWDVDLRKNVVTARLDLAHERVAGFGGTVGAELVRHDGVTRGPTALEPGATVTSFGIYAFEELEAGRATLSAGARLSHRRLHAEPNAATSDPDLLRRTYTVLAGSFGAVVRAGEAWAVATNVTSGFRAPTLFELFADGEHGGVAAYQIGSPRLEPERSLGADLSLRFQSAGARGEVAVYGTVVRDYIYLENTGAETDGGLPVYRAGQTDASLRGVEGSAEVDLTAWLSVGGDFSLVHGTGDDIESREVGGEGELPLLPAGQVGGFVRLRGSRVGRLLAPGLRLAVRHVGAKDAAGVIEPFSQFDLIPFGTASTEAYTLLDVEATTVVRAGPANLSVALTVTNLLDTAYRSFLDTYKGYALSMGRNVGLRVSVPLAFASDAPES